MGEEERGRLKCKELLWWRHSDLRGAMETPVMGGRRGVGMQEEGVGGGFCDVDVPLSAKADNLLKSNSSDESSLRACAHRGCVHERADLWVCVHPPICRSLCVSFAGCVGVRLLFVGVSFNLTISKGDAACSTATGFKGKSTQLGPNNGDSHLEPVSTRT